MPSPTDSIRRRARSGVLASHYARPPSALAGALTRRAQPQPGRPLLAQELNNWGVNCYQPGYLDGAAQHIGEALALWQADLPADYNNVLAARASLAALETNRGYLAANLRYQGRAAGAAAVALPAWQRAQTFYTAPQLSRSSTSIDYTRSLAESGRCAEALPLAQAALEEATALKPAAAFERGFALDVLGKYAFERRDFGDALARLEGAVGANREAKGTGDWRMAIARGRLALALIKLGDQQKAQKALSLATIGLTSE